MRSAHSQTVPKAADVAQANLADFGLVYPRSNEWVRATEMLRGKVESSSNPAPNFDVPLAAVYVSRSNLSETSPFFFSLRAYRQPATDWKKSLEAMIAHSQDKKDQPESGVKECSATVATTSVSIWLAVLAGVISASSALRPTAICWFGMRVRQRRKD